MRAEPLVWAGLVAAQAVPQITGPLDWVAHNGAIYPGERVFQLMAFAGFSMWLYVRSSGSDRGCAGVLLACSAAMFAAASPRWAYQPLAFLVQVAVAVQLYGWAVRNGRSSARTIAWVQGFAAVVVFPLAQLAYGLEVHPGPASALVADFGPIAALAVPVLGTIAVSLALARDARAPA